MRCEVGAGVVIAGDAFEMAAALGTIFVDGAAVVEAEEDAAAFAIGKDVLDDGMGGMLDGYRDGEGGELAALFASEKGGVLVAVLLATFC